MGVAEAGFFLCVFGYISFRHWLRHDRRRMLHRERLAALEKGIELPAVETEAERRTWNVQRFLLVAGLSWVAIGIGGGAVLHHLTTNRAPEWAGRLPPEGTEWAALTPIGVGIAHLITYWIGERRGRSVR